MMYLATLETSHFSFAALGATADAAINALCLAWGRHQQQTGTAAPWIEFAEDVQILPMQIGTAYRDGQPL